MKHHTKRILSLLLAACMMLGLLPALALTSWAEGETAVAYDEAADGDLLYTVNFGFDDVYTKHVVDTTATATVSEDGHKLTFSDKPRIPAETEVDEETGEEVVVKWTSEATYYGGFLTDYRIVGNVYTISYYTETTSLSIRSTVQLFNEGTRIGLSNKSGTTNTMTIVSNGTTGENIPYTVERKVDTENSNRQFYKVVIDGVNLNARFYVLDTNDVYSLLAEVAIDPLAGHNYLAIGLYNWDALSGENYVAVGDVEIRKGDEFATGEKTAYQLKYDSLEDGDVLYEVDFRSDNKNGFDWGSHRATSNLTENAISEDGTTLTLNNSQGAQVYSAYLPDREAVKYGCITYEFFVKSDKRTGINVLGTTGDYAVGFSYFNTTATNIFMAGAGWDSGTGNLAKSVNRAKGYVVGEAQQTPNTDDETKPNVKIEINPFTATATNYILNDEGEFVPTAIINYGGGTHYAIVYPYAWDANTNAVFKNIRIVKGLSVSGKGDSLVDVRVDGEYQTVTPQYWSENPAIHAAVNGMSGVPEVSELPELPELSKPNYLPGVYQLPDGTVLESINDLTFEPGYNLIDLVTVYTPEPITNGEVQVRAVQTLESPTEGVTAVRFAAILNDLSVDEVGFVVYALYKDSTGTIHSGTGSIDLKTATVWTSIVGGGVTVTAEELGGSYVYALAVNNVPMGEGVQVDFYVTPYSVTGGEMTYGDMATVSIVNGEYAEDAAPLVPTA